MSFVLYQTYEFSTWAPGILGGFYKNMELKAMMGYQEAKFYRDIDAVEESILPSLPSGTPPKEKQTYLLFKPVDMEEKILFSKDWIDPASIQSATTGTIVATVFNANINPGPGTSSDVDVIRQLLQAAGFQTFNVKISS